jgi:hypothetical protein
MVVTDTSQRQRGGETRAAAVLARAPVWAWSASRANLAFCDRLGFEVLDEVLRAEDAPTIFPTRREPVG